MALGEPDASGRRRPEPRPGSERLVTADAAIIAAGFGGDEGFASTIPGIAHRAGLYVVDPATGATNLPGVFAGGDSVHGADIVVTAIAEGKRAAAGILAFLEQRTPVA
jgi:glutamate synthase (NADPH/NADH) small chain